jgi:phenylalanyl-tRNA synthetase alpha chain
MLIEKLQQIKEQALTELELVFSDTDAESFRIKYLGRSGVLTEALKELKDLDVSLRPQAGKFANEIKQLITEKLDLKLSLSLGKKTEIKQDLTLPGIKPKTGYKHPISKVMDECVDIFRNMGFAVEFGPDIETDFHNFEALNIPSNHPAREMHDTFYITDNILLRTHTSPVQIRTMIDQEPPLRVIAPGKVYRRDSDITHSPMFHQIEGLMVDKNISFSDLKGVLILFLHQIFGDDIKIRFRPSFFPFTEPSAEVDISCVMCAGKGCRVCSNTGWLEILGAGMVDPEVFKAVEYDSESWTGFAFGVGVERIAMLKYGIGNIRLFFENNLDFLSQF